MEHSSKAAKSYQEGKELSLLRDRPLSASAPPAFQTGSQEPVLYTTACVDCAHGSRADTAAPGSPEARVALLLGIHLMSKKCIVHKIRLKNPREYGKPKPALGAEEHHHSDAHFIQNNVFQTFYVVVIYKTGPSAE